ncbi:hypothetical protein C491_07241 [Natronococcus amylolyticus DSM 10524]|uniref:Uncharacterized protein n=1 Tax=Natronococcus amylolyticus DSM 10524 TaxID=1227497 RepID=L9XCG6_9EURY|nr:hypothetical protein [Natronococcus amylolyticus]ELY59116.1 hypothetical protein C491_07241 [Natronococcus amylolyticus DSM 10524]
MSRSDEAAYTELEPDAWHQNEQGNYSIDCPECGSEATLMNVVKHGRCNGYLSKHDEDIELDTQPMDCTAKLWFELGYVSDPDESMTDDAVGADDGEDETDQDVESGEGVPASDSPAGAEGTVDDDQTQ